MNCDLCRCPIQGEYYQNFWREVWCATHPAIQCNHCSRLLSSTLRSEPSAIPCCSICAGISVTQPDVLLRQTYLVQGWLAREGLKTPDKFSLALVSQIESGSGNSSDSDRVLGQASAVLEYDLSGTRLKDASVKIVQSLPLDLCLGVLAHELAHLFLYEHDLTGWTPMQKEGFCEAVAYRWYTQRATERTRFFAHKMERNSCPVYGDGFRFVQAHIEKHGWEQTLQHIKRIGRLPNF